MTSRHLACQSALFDANADHDVEARVVTTARPAHDTARIYPDTGNRRIEALGVWYRYVGIRGSTADLIAEAHIVDVPEIPCCAGAAGLAEPKLKSGVTTGCGKIIGSQEYLARTTAARSGNFGIATSFEFGLHPMRISNQARKEQLEMT